jgi:hypothetical protein
MCVCYPTRGDGKRTGVSNVGEVNHAPLLAELAEAAPTA